MLDREIGLTGPDPEKAADRPAAGEARVERQRTVDQPDHGADILSKYSQRVGGVGEDARVVLARLERPPGKIDTLAARRPRLFGPAVSDERHVAHRRPGERRPVMPIDRDRLLKQSEGFENPLLCSSMERRKRAQIEIVSGKITDRSVGGAGGL